MPSISLIFKIHQPVYLRQYRFFDIGKEDYYYNDYLNKSVIQRLAKNCYLPANETMLKLIKMHGDQFKLSYTISGITLELLKVYAPEVIESFAKLAQTGNVEFLAETYAHSLASLKNPDEFVRQVEKHQALIQSLFNTKPVFFCNSELVYNNIIGEMAGNLGFKGILTEGAKHVLGWRSPNFVYYNNLNPKLKVIVRNFKLSDDIAFRFNNTEWNEWPLTADKFAAWLNTTDKKEETINIVLDYHILGEYMNATSGIFNFFTALPAQVINKTNFTFATPSEIITKHQPVAPFIANTPISWADEERDLTTWTGNELQNEALTKLYLLKEKVYLANDNKLYKNWERLQISDHFRYMSNKLHTEAIYNRLFNPYSSPYEAFINYMNVLSDFTKRVNEAVELTENENLTDKQIKDIINSLILREKTIFIFLLC